jgi:hypothetical protein
MAPMAVPRFYPSDRKSSIWVERGKDALRKMALAFRHEAIEWGGNCKFLES